MVKFTIAGIDKDNHINWIKKTRNCWWQHGGGRVNDPFRIALGLFSNVGLRQQFLRLTSKIEAIEKARIDKFQALFDREGIYVAENATWINITHHAQDYFHSHFPVSSLPGSNI